MTRAAGVDNAGNGESSMFDQVPSLLQGLSPRDAEDALSRFRRMDVEQGVRLIEEGERDPTLCLVASGELGVYRGDTLVGRVRPGEVIGEMALFTGAPRSATVAAVTPVQILALDWSTYDWLRRQRHPAAFAVEEHALSDLSSRLRRTGDRIAGLAKGTPLEAVVPTPGFFDRMAVLLGSGGVVEASFDAAEVLGKSRLFAGASLELLREVGACFDRVGMRTGHFLCREGTPGDEMFILASGVVEVLVSTQKDRVEPVARLRPGDAFGMCSLVHPDQPRMASCVALERVTALSMGKIRWAETATRSDLVGSVLRVAMIRALSEQLGVANEQIARLDHARTDTRLLAKAGAAVEAHGDFLAEAEREVPSYLAGVDRPW